MADVVDLAWSGGFLSARGSLKIEGNLAVLEIDRRNGMRELVRFTRPLEDIKHSLRWRDGGRASALRITGPALSVAIERLRPYLSDDVIKRYETAAAESARRRMGDSVPSV